MPINPTTKREQIYPTNGDIKEFKEFDISRESAESFNERMTPKHYSVLFGMVNTIATSEALPGEVAAKRVDDLRQQLSEVSTTKPSLEIWLSELIQNAMDANWGDGLGASEISIDFTETNITFWHNGRPPQHLGFQKNEVSKMVESGSTKRSDLNSEGRFGIGFKYWTYYFTNVLLSADGWSLGWNDQMEFSPISDSVTNSGMQLVFSKPTKDCLADLQQFQKSLDQLFSRGLTRLVEGLSVQDTPIRLIVSTNGVEQFQLSHTVNTHQYSHSEGMEVQIFTVENELNNPDEIAINGYIPNILLGCDIKKALEEIGQEHPVHIALIDALIDEFNPELQKPSVEKILKAESEFSSYDWNSDENVRYSAQQQIHKLDSICMFDLSPELQPHHQLFSMFAIEKYYAANLWQNTKKTPCSSRVLFKGTYQVDRERTRLESFESRNKSISYAQCYSSNLLLHLLTFQNFRERFNISDKMHKEIFDSFEERLLDKEFQSLLHGYSIISELDKFDVYPAVRWEEEEPVQIFIPASEARPLREELVEMINSEVPDVRKWARSILEPDEICVIQDDIDSESEFSLWSTFTPWHCSLEDEGGANYEAIFETQVPEFRVVEQIVPHFKGKWPEWMPLPLGQDGEATWKLETNLQDSIVMRSTDQEIGMFDDPFSLRIHEHATKLGMSSYHLAPGFESLVGDNNRIRTIPVEPPSEERLFELSVKKVVESNAGIIRHLLNAHPQSHSYWPIFVETLDGKLLMVEKPSSGWQSTFFCINDRYPSHRKSLWSYSKRGSNAEFTPITDSRSNKNTTCLYIKNLDDSTVFFSHLLHVEAGGLEYSQAVRTVIQEYSNQTGVSVPFSQNDYHYINNGNTNSLGNKAKLNIGVFKFLPQTSQETKDKMLSELPPMPNLLHALPMPVEVHENIEMPRFRRNRNANFNAMYSTNLPQSSIGFARHIFNLVDDESSRNNNQIDSLREIPQIEKELYDGEYSVRTDEENKVDWMECLSNYRPDNKNYTMILRFMSPALASIEHLQKAQSHNLLHHSLALSAFEGTYPGKVSPLSAPSATTKPNFQTWYAYVTNTPNDSLNQSQRLQIERAKVDSMNQADGMINQTLFLWDDKLSAYRDRVGFSTKSDNLILEQPLWGENERPSQQTTHLEKLWSTKNSGDRQGHVVKMLISVMKELSILPFPLLALKHQEELNTNAQLYVQAQSSIQNDLQLQLLSSEILSDSAELTISRWLFHPGSSSIDALMRDFVQRCTGDCVDLSRVVEAIWKRMKTEFPDSPELCLDRLNDWVLIPHEAWRGVVSDSFLESIEQAQENSGNESLHSQINQAQDYQEAMVAMRRQISRRYRYHQPATWRPLTVIESSQHDSMILTKYDSWFGTTAESNRIKAKGFGLLPATSLFPLSNDEFSALQNKQNSRLNPTFVEDLIVEHWIDVMNRFFQSARQNLENSIVVTGTSDSISEKHSFLLDRMRWFMLSMPESPSENRTGFLDGLPDIGIESTRNPNWELAKEDNSLIYQGLTLGPCGWHVLFSESRLTFYTTKPISEELLADKYKMLSALLRRIMMNFKIDWTDRKLLSRDFIHNFGVDYRTNCKVDPLVDFTQWYDEYNDGLIEPNQSFMNHLDGDEWASVEGAEKLLEALTNDAKSWLSTGHLSASDVKPELQKMYDNGITCTLPDFRTPFLSAAFGTDEAVRMTIVRLHSGPAQNPVGILAENMNRTDKIGTKIKNLGNTLLLSDNARARGAITNGWRLVAPLDSGYDNFLTYLKECWKELFVGESADLDRILLKGVVKYFSHDPDHDDFGNIVLHKLHILYILSFAAATEIEGVE